MTICFPLFDGVNCTLHEEYITSVNFFNARGKLDRSHMRKVVGNNSA